MDCCEKPSQLVCNRVLVPRSLHVLTAACCCLQRVAETSRSSGALLYVRIRWLTTAQEQGASTGRNPVERIICTFVLWFIVNKRTELCTGRPAFRPTLSISDTHSGFLCLCFFPSLCDCLRKRFVSFVFSQFSLSCRSVYLSVGVSWIFCLLSAASCVFSFFKFP